MTQSTTPPKSESTELRERLVKIFEANFLDGDKVQRGQMLASTEVVEYIDEFVLPLFSRETRQARIEGYELALAKVKSRGYDKALEYLGTLDDELESLEHKPLDGEASHAS